MKHIVPWLLLMVLFGSLGGVAVFVLRARGNAGRDLPAYSVYSEEPDGLAETARFLGKLGWEPIALTRPILQLFPGDTPRLLVMVEPQPAGFGLTGEAEFSPSEVRGLVRWVEAGNTLLLCGRHSNGLHTALGITLQTDLPEAKAEALRTVVPAEAGRYTEGIERLAIEGRDQLHSDRGLPLWWVDNQPGALIVRRGQGRVIVVADPSLLTRRGIVREDNALFLYNVVQLHARAGQVYFDEYHHGFHSGGGFWGYLSYYGLHATLVPILVVLLVAGWAVGVRLGPAVPQLQATQTDAVDYASSLARIYEGAGVRHLMAEALARDFTTRLTRLLKLRRSAKPAEVLAAWARQEDTDAASLAPLLDDAAGLGQGSPSEALLLRHAQDFDRFFNSTD